MVSNRGKPLGLDVTRTSAVESPPGIAALFVIRFDIRTGYVISWKRSVPEVDVEGAVEYKSLPSGLHNIQEDLVYFVHEQYAGISAFVNHPAEESERNAKMFAIGVLVPLSFGRLGKSWRHASRLKYLAQQYAQDMNSDPLSEYWDTYQIRETDVSAAPDSPLDSPISLRFRPNGERPDNLHRNRAFSDALVLETSRPALTPFHPASSLPDFIDCFGPLVFPLYRAALLRKRVLLLAEAPVHVPCNYVYDLSLLASIPNSLLPLLPSDKLPSPRPRPLFNVGIHDIPYLSSLSDPTANKQDPAWIACTTDSVLSMKSELYDALVTLPPPYSKHAAEKQYPKITVSAPTTSKHKQPQTTELKATQRDARRYSILRKALHQISPNRAADETEEDSDAASTYSSSTIVEPLSWTRLAYTSFIWWASAGEKRDGLSEEEEEQQIEQDTRLLASVESLSAHFPGTLARRSTQTEDPQKQPPEIALVAYFRRLTSQIFITISDVIARHDNDDLESAPDDDLTDLHYQDSPDDEQEPSAVNARQSIQADDDDNSPLLQSGARDSRHNGAGNDGPVTITSADMAEMGLDVWSAVDRIFVVELVALWWKREVKVDTARVRCCGVTIL